MHYQKLYSHRKASEKLIEAIASVKKKIAVLEAHLVGLMQTDEGLTYIAEYEELSR